MQCIIRQFSYSSLYKRSSINSTNFGYAYFVYKLSWKGNVHVLWRAGWGDPARLKDLSSRRDAGHSPLSPPHRSESASAFSAQWYRRSGTVVSRRVWSSVCERSDHACSSAEKVRETTSKRGLTSQCLLITKEEFDVI